MGSVPVNGRHIKLNGAIVIMCGILKFVVASAAEAELAALFINAKEGKNDQNILFRPGRLSKKISFPCFVIAVS